MEILIALTAITSSVSGYFIYEDWKNRAKYNKLFITGKCDGLEMFYGKISIEGMFKNHFFFPNRHSVCRVTLHSDASTADLTTPDSSPAKTHCHDPKTIIGFLNNLTTDRTIGGTIWLEEPFRDNLGIDNKLSPIGITSTDIIGTITTRTFCTNLTTRIEYDNNIEQLVKGDNGEVILSRKYELFEGADRAVLVDATSGSHSLAKIIASPPTFNTIMQDEVFKINDANTLWKYAAFGVSTLMFSGLLVRYGRGNNSRKN